MALLTRYANVTDVILQLLSFFSLCLLLFSNSALDDLSSPCPLWRIRRYREYLIRLLSLANMQVVQLQRKAWRQKPWMIFLICKA